MIYHSGKKRRNFRLKAESRSSFSLIQLPLINATLSTKKGIKGKRQKEQLTSIQILYEQKKRKQRHKCIKCYYKK